MSFVEPLRIAFLADGFFHLSECLVYGVATWERC